MRLGRLYQPDPRDRAFPLRAVMGVTAPVTERIWRTEKALDQGESSMCVGFSWTTFLRAAPLLSARYGEPMAVRTYTVAQTLDDWPGTDYEGTSVRAGAQALQSFGVIKEYVWAWKVSEVRNFVLNRGPVVLGTDWWDTMFEPVKGYLEVGGSLAGGHAYCCVGYSLKRDAFRIENSWGNDWGQRGRAWMKSDALTYLLEQTGGEACSALEVRVV